MIGSNEFPANRDREIRYMIVHDEVVLEWRTHRRAAE
jgi:hypothetical protein